MTRAAAVVAAVVVAAFFGLAVRQSTAEKTATQRLDAGRTDEPTAASLDRAAQLNPDAEVDVLRARLAVDQGDLAEARRLLLGIVRREPENARAWGTIQLVFGTTDPALAKRAAATFDRLVPTVPDP